MITNFLPQLEKVVEIIRSEVPVEMIILFGSTARGEHVSDVTTIGHVTYEYQSDFDLLVVVKSEKVRDDVELWDGIKKKISEDTQIKVPVSLVVDTVNFVSKKLLEGNYFYSDVKKEGEVLYDSQNFTLPDPRNLSPKKQADLAQKDFEFWMTKANDFLKDYEHNMADKSYNNAAFHLSQVTES